MIENPIKKATVLKKDLPPVNSENQYLVRYRVVSEDRNRVSAWTSIATIPGPEILIVEGNVSVLGSSIVAIWSDQNNRPRYDIFVKFNTDTDFYYHGTSAGNNYSFIKTLAATSVSIQVQVEGTEKLLRNNLKVYSLSGVSLL